jgi:hypothetical protein
MNVKGRYIFTSIVVAAALAFIALPSALALTNYVTITAPPFTSTTCTGIIGVEVGPYESNSPTGHTYGENEAKNLRTNSTGTAQYDFSTPRSNTSSWSAANPGDLILGDVVRFTVNWYSDPARTQLFYSAWVEYVCDTGEIVDYSGKPEGSKTEKPTFPWYYAPGASSDATLALYQQVPFNGQVACGVFDVGWWGIKYAAPDQFPGCAAYLPDHVEMACFTADGQWTKDNVANEHVNGDGFFGATVTQHGTCGIFPTP